MGKNRRAADGGNPTSEEIAWTLHQVLSSLGFDDYLVANVSLRVARRAAIAVAPEKCADLWTILFARLAQSGVAGRPDLGELLGEAEFGSRAALTKNEVKRLAREQRLLSLSGAGGGPRYPSFQIWQGELLKGAEEINHATAAARLNDYTRITMYFWPVDGGLSILNALRSGLTSEAIEIARDFRGFRF